MLCYEIPYTNRYGKHTCTKWGDSPKDALAAAKKALSKRSGLGEPEFGDPVLIFPQPFSDESRALHAARKSQHQAELAANDRDAAA